MPGPICLPLLDAMRKLTGPRERRGVRHPCAALLALAPPGLLCRQSDFTPVARWAGQHRDEPEGPLGFTRKYATHGATLGRARALHRASEFAPALPGWMRALLDPGLVVTAAAGGKTSKQARGAGGDPIRAPNVFAHDLEVCLARWPVGGGRDTGPGALKARLDGPLADWPALRLLTGGATFAQRPLARLITGRGKGHPVSIKENQPDLLEAAAAAFSQETPRTAGAAPGEKKGGAW